MKVLFIAREKKNGQPGVVVLNQAEALRSYGIHVDFFLIKKGGILGYIFSFFKLKSSIIKKFDIIHAHYGLCGLIAALKSKGNLVVSLMGSDVLNSSKFLLSFYQLIAKKKWNAIIFKSHEMSNYLSCPNNYVIPNGVDMDFYKQISTEDAKIKLKLELSTSYILFVGDPNRAEKNFELAKKSTENLKDFNIKLLVANDVPKKEMPYYYNASNALLVTSIYEGSMNAIKEAMSCNIPILSTNVGDAHENLLNLNWCEIIPYDSKIIQKKIISLCKEHKRTSGREKLLDLKLDQTSINHKIHDVYVNISKRSNSN